MASSKPKKVTVNESRRFMIDCLKACNNVPQTHAEEVSDLLVNADYRQIYCHGMNNLETCIYDLEHNYVDGAAVPIIINETPVIACVDGNNGFGAVIGNFCMNLAIKKAKQYGIGYVSAKHSNYYGMPSYYSSKAVKEGLIGISMSNTQPVMVPTRSKEAALGENPLSLAVPAKNDHYVLDMTTTVVSAHKVEVTKKQQNVIPKGWAQDEDGKITIDAERAYENLLLFPLGGSELTSGFKGYGFAAVIDILSGVLSGANYSKNIKKMGKGNDGEANLGHVFIVIDPNYFAPNFEENMMDFNRRLRCSQPTDPTRSVLVHGDREHMAMNATDADGIEYSEIQLKTCLKFAKQFDIPPLKFLDDF